MKLINKKDNQITFTTEIEESLANSIRRYLNQIPLLAVEDVAIERNDSPLYDETIAHRIGLIPLKMDKKGGKKALKISLNTKKEGIVFSQELKGDLKIVYDQIPITSLNKGQELKLSASIKSGLGVEHSRFSPGLMFYRNVVDVKIGKDCPKNVVDVCPQGILKIREGNVVVENNSKCDMCEACVELCVKQGKEPITLVPSKELMITLESFGQLSVENIFSESIRVLKQDLTKISKEIKKS